MPTKPDIPAEAVEAAEAVISNLNDRRGFGTYGLDDEIQAEIRDSFASIIADKMLPVAERAYREGHDEGTQVPQGRNAAARASICNYDWLHSKAHAALAPAGKAGKEANHE